MTNIEILLKGHTIFDQRKALYYLGRYIKQATIFENYMKDIFVDSDENPPSENVVSLTNILIADIEKATSKKASKFTDHEFHFWMDKIAEIEDNLDEEPSEDIVQKAMTKLESFDIPKKND